MKALKIGIVGAAALLAVVMVLGLGRSPERGNQGAGPADYANAEAVYVGSEECRDCHQRQYWGWKETLHPYKIQVADEKTVVGDFYSNNSLTAGGYTTRMSVREGKYFVTTLDRKGEERTYEIAYTIGGSQWKQLYLTRFPNGALQILPVQWNLESEEWVDYFGLKRFKPGDDKYWDSPDRTWQYRCAGCHTTGLRINRDRESGYFATEWADMGVGCESCHGPGGRHIEADGADKIATIVNPSKLNYRMGIEVCGSCHIRGKSPDGKYGYPEGYRPGVGSRGLLFTYVPVTPEKNPERFWKATGDSKKNHQQYIDFVKSRHAEAGVACWDCHEPHGRGMSNRFELKLPGRMLCVSCHGEPNMAGERAGLSHSIHDFGGCVDCHMPATAKNALPGDTRSHRFAVLQPQVSIGELLKAVQAEDARVLRFFGLKAEDVKGLNDERLGELLKDKARQAEREGRPIKGLLKKIQPNSCNGCHYHRFSSPWKLQGELVRDRGSPDE